MLGLHITPGKARAGVAAVEVFLDHFFDHRTKEAIFLLKTLLIFRDKPLEMMKEHPIEDGAFRMTRTVDSRHIGKARSKSVPGAYRRESTARTWIPST